MMLEFVDIDFFFKVFANQSGLYSSRAFIDLNKNKTEQVVGLILRDNKGHARCGIIGGVIGDVFKAPFSAPFATFCSARDRLRIDTLTDLVEMIKSNFSGVKITLPSAIYNEMTSVAAGSLISAGYSMSVIYNYHWHIDSSVNAVRMFFPSAKNHLNKAIRVGCKTESYSLSRSDGLSNEKIEKLNLAWRIIKHNRDEKGYPLALSCQNLVSMLDLVDMDVFITTIEDKPVAAAIVYRYNSSIAQLIYWGNIKEGAAYMPMYALAEAIYDYYSEIGYNTVDLGGASNDGKPDKGLCSFKESLGACLTFKPVAEV